MTDATTISPAAPHTPQAKGPFGPLYNWVMRLAAGRHAEPALYTVSFTESSFFPIPPDVMLAPMCFARPERWVRYAFGCTLASVFGALLGYAIGFYLWEAVGSQIISFFGYGGKEEELRLAYATAGVWIIFLKGITPIPFKLVTIVSGAMAFNLPIFIAACLFTRGIRFFLVAWLLSRYGERMREFIERRLGLLTILGVLGVVAGFAVLKLL